MHAGCTFANLNGNTKFWTGLASSAVLNDCHFIENVAARSVMGAYIETENEAGTALVKLQNCTFANNTSPTELSAGPWDPEIEVVYYSSDSLQSVENEVQLDYEPTGDTVTTAAAPLEEFPEVSAALSGTDPFIVGLQEVCLPTSHSCFSPGNGDTSLL